MDFFGLGFGEILVVVVVALLLFGPGKMAEVGRTIGKVARDLRKTTSDFTAAMAREADELKQPMTDVAAEIKAGTTEPAPAIEPPAASPSSPQHSARIDNGS